MPNSKPAAASTLSAVGAADTGEVTVESFVWRIVAGDRVDYASDRIASVEQRCGSFDDLNSFDRQDIDRLGMIARLETKSADAIAVLQHEHAIAIKTANHGTRGSRSETSFRDPSSPSSASPSDTGLFFASSIEPSTRLIEWNC